MLGKAFEAEIRGIARGELGCRHAAQHETMRIPERHGELGIGMEKLEVCR